MASAPPPQAKNPPRNRFRFGLATLLLFILVFSFVLSRYYPRVCYSVTVRTGAPNPQAAMTCSALARSSTVLQGVIDRCPEVASHADGDALNWLKTHVHAEPTDDNLIRVMIVGRPKDAKHYTQVVESVADELIAFLQQAENERSNAIREVIGAMQDELGEPDTQPHEIDVPPDPDTLRRTQLRASLENRLAQLEGELQNSKQADLEIVKKELTWQP